MSCEENTTDESSAVAVESDGDGYDESNESDEDEDESAAVAVDDGHGHRWAGVMSVEPEIRDDDYGPFRHVDEIQHTVDELCCRDCGLRTRPPDELKSMSVWTRWHEADSERRFGVFAAVDWVTYDDYRKLVLEHEIPVFARGVLEHAAAAPRRRAGNRPRWAAARDALERPVPARGCRAGKRPWWAGMSVFARVIVAELQKHGLPKLLCIIVSSCFDDRPLRLDVPDDHRYLWELIVDSD